MTAIVITSAVVFLFFIGTMTVLYYRTAAELEKANREIERLTSKLRSERSGNEETINFLWKSLMAKDGADEIHFGEF